MAQVDENLYRSGVLSAQDIKELGKMGIKTVVAIDQHVIKKYDVAREKYWVEQAGMTYVYYPLLPIFHLDKTKFVSVYNILKTVEKPALVHCKRGSDRTGIVVGMWRVLVSGWSVEAAIDEMNSYGFNPIFRHWQKDFREIVENNN